MTYLITEILILLAIVALIGVILGYLMCKICGGCKCNCDACGCGKSSSKKSSKKKNVEKDLKGPAFIDHDDNTAVMVLDTNINLDSDDYQIETLEGVGAATGKIFRDFGVSTVGDYLRKLHSPSQRQQASKSLSILIKPLNDWASQADLLRVEGIDHQWAELAHAAGIETVGDLAKSDPVSLVARMEDVNNAGKQLISPTVPTSDEVANWIARARNMASVVTV